MHIELSQHVDAPPESCFAVWTDFEHAADIIGAIEKIQVLTPGPVGVGTTFAETRTMFGKASTETLEVTGFEPDRSVTVEAESCGARYVCVFTFIPDEAGTRVRLTVDTQAQTLLAKLMAPLGWLMSGTMKKMMRQDLIDAAAYCVRDTVTDEPV